MTSETTFQRLVSANRQLDGPPLDFLRFRRNQLDLILHHARIPRGGTFLEIGGGVSGQAFLLTDLAERVVCTDLLDVESAYGGRFADAAALRRWDAKHRLHYVCARGEAIPLRDECVDVVFSSFVFEHIEDRAAAVSEIYRVLRPGGYVVTNVPNRLRWVYRVLSFCLGSAPKQVLKAALVWSGVAQRCQLVIRAPIPRPRTRADVGRWLRSTFTYPPHGAYPGHLDEFRESGIGHWDGLFQERGFTIGRRFTVTLENHVAFFNSRLIYRTQELLLPLTRRWGDSGPAVLFGVSYCFVARKAPVISGHAPQ